MTTRLPASGALFIGLAFVACGEGTSGSSGVGGHDGSSSGNSTGLGVPVNQRASDAQCLQPAPAGSCMGTGGPTSTCSHDSDCTAGTNGRCAVSTGDLVSCGCTYDACSQDSDCPAGQTCACHGSAYSTGGNVCVPGNCRVDSDCGSGAYCSPSSGGCGGISGYYCHTARDACVNDGDCGNGVQLQACVYSTSNERWECRPVGCA